jgi:PAS domain S-box-containing protein
MVSQNDLGPPESQLSQLFEQAPGFLAMLEGPSHVFRLANHSYRSLVGNRELIGIPAREAFPELTAAPYLALLDQVFSSGEAHIGRRSSLRLAGPGGQARAERFIDFVYQPVLGPGGTPSGIFVQGHDVSELVFVEQRLEAKVRELELERRIFDTALSFSNDFNYTFDREGRFTYVNKALLSLWGLSLDQAIGRTFTELPYEADLANRLCEQIRGVVETATQFRGETYYRGPSGKEGWYEYIFNPVFDASGEVIAVAGSTRDVTERVLQDRKHRALVESERAARSEAERAGRAKDEFLATLSHELRTPLNSILGWGELLRSGRLSAEKARDGVERIISSGKAQAQLISDLLDMSAIASQKARLQVQRLSLLKPLRAAIDAITPSALTKGVVVAPLDYTAGIEIDCDPDRMQQVFWNLLSNAVKFTPEGGTIAVAVEADGEEAQVRITDSGCGIESSFLPRLFDRFSQADGSSTRHYSGLGLGLSICRTLVEMHGGTISAHSEGVGRGATFAVTLPLPSAGTTVTSTWGDSSSLAPVAEQATPLEGLQVIVVDDDAESRSFLRELLEEYGASVSECASASVALRLLHDRDFGLLLCDIGMPEKDGYTLMREIRSSSAARVERLPSIALTAFARPQDEARARTAGFDAHLAKPAEPRVIIETCLRVLAQAVVR